MSFTKFVFSAVVTITLFGIIVAKWSEVLSALELTLSVVALIGLAEICVWLDSLNSTEEEPKLKQR